MIRYSFAFYIISLLFSMSLRAQSNKVTEEGLIFPLQEKHVHGSSLAVLPNGDVLAAWFYGSGERGADDVCIMGARKKAGSKRWSAPFLMADTKGIPDCNPVLFLNQKKQLYLVWIAVQANRWEQSVLRYRVADRYQGGGAPAWNWQDNILLKPDSGFVNELKEKLAILPKQQHGWAAYAPPYDEMILNNAQDLAKRSFGWMTRIKPLLLADNKILLPLYSDGFNCSLVAISEDDGNTWRPSKPIVGRGNIQPTFVRRTNGDIVAYMRDSGDAPARIQESVSTDDGETWTVARKTDIPNTASVEALCLRDGRWLLVANDVDDGRYQLSLYVSDNEGAAWKRCAFLETDRNKSLSCSYPSIVQSVDGFIHLSYSYHVTSNKKSIKYVKISPDDIK